MAEKAKNTQPDNTGTREEQLKAPDYKFETFVVHSARYKTLYTKKYINRKKWQKPNEKHVLSFIPGTITKIYVNDGDPVEKDQPLLILEAMKMENTVFALNTGTIKKVYVNTGDKVPKGFLMIEFE